jgi:hypothetical protein
MERGLSWAGYREKCQNSRSALANLFLILYFIIRRREAKVLGKLGGGKEMRFDLCQYYIRQLPRYKAFGSG